MYADDVASVIIARSGTWLDAMKLQKLLYYAQAWHLAVTGEVLFNEPVKAWKNGPVVPQVWHARKDRGSREPTRQDIGGIQLDSVTSDLLDLVLASYGTRTGQELSLLTHGEQPWREARGDLAEDVEGSDPISPETMAHFYREHGLLGGRRAADLAAGGIHIRTEPHDGEPFDLDAFLASLGDAASDPGKDSLPGGNLEAPAKDLEGISTEPYRAYPDC